MLSHITVLHFKYTVSSNEPDMRARCGRMKRPLGQGQGLTSLHIFSSTKTYYYAPPLIGAA